MAVSKIPYMTRRIPDEAITLTSGHLFANGSYVNGRITGLDIEIAEITPTTTDTWFTAALLAEEYCPSVNVFAIGLSTNGSYLNAQTFIVRVTPDGKIQFMNHETANRYYFLNLSYHD